VSQVQLSGHILVAAHGVQPNALLALLAPLRSRALDRGALPPVVLLDAAAQPDGPDWADVARCAHVAWYSWYWQLLGVAVCCHSVMCCTCVALSACAVIRFRNG
jgi:hypothetical protein